jgi:hypothetical protein
MKTLGVVMLAAASISLDGARDVFNSGRQARSYSIAESIKRAELYSGKAAGSCQSCVVGSFFGNGGAHLNRLMSGLGFKLISIVRRG